MTEVSIAQLLAQIEVLKTRNKVKAEEILENEEAISVLTFRIIEKHNEKLSEEMTKKEKSAEPKLE